MTGDRRTNWAGNIEYEATLLHQPESLADLCSLVANAPRAKALGNRHSFTTIADAPGEAQISTERLDSTIVVDHNQMTATVPGGLSYGAVAVALEEEGVALANMGSLPHISVAGGTATGTHGSGDTNQVLAGAIAGVELVTADGTVRHVERPHPDLAAIAVGLGAFGIITRVTLDVEPSYLMRQDIYRDLPWESVLDGFDDLMANAYSVNVLSLFASPVVAVVIQKSRVAVNADGIPFERDTPASLFGGWLDAEDELGGPQDTPRRGEPGPWLERLPHFRLDAEPSMAGDELQTDYMVARDDAPAAISALRAMGEEIDQHLWAVEIRSVAADDLWMSPACGRDSVSIGFTWKKHPTEVLALLPRVEAALAPFEPRPHWGKLFTLDRLVLEQRIERLGDFLALIDAYDPHGSFANPFLGRLRSP